MAGLLTLLAFGFAANALLSTPQAESPAVTRTAPPAVASAAPAPAQALDTAESPEVAAVTRNWVWETREAPPRSPTAYDFEELWLAR